MDLSDLRERAASAFAKGRFAKAAEIYEAYCAQAPKDSQAWIRLGDTWVRLKKKDKAAAAYYEAAKSYTDSGFFPRAIAACKLVLEIEPEHLGVKSMLGELYAHKADAKHSSFGALPLKHIPTSPGGGPNAKEEAKVFVQEESSTSTPIPLPGKVVSPEEGMPIVLGQEELPGGVEPQPSPQPLWAKALKPPVIHSTSKAFYAIEEAAKASLVERGENPNVWLKAAKHSVPSAGLPVDIPLFSELPQAALMALFRHCPLRRFKARSQVIAQGERGNSFFVICLGAVRVFRLQGSEQVELATLKEGEFFGEMALLSGEPRSAFVEATEPDTQVLEISAEVLTGLSRKFPQVSTALWRFYRQRLLSNVMASSALFRPFTFENRQRLIRHFQAVDVGVGTEVVVQNRMSEGLFVILTGRLEVVKDGQRIAELREGELFGEISLLTKAPATASVRAAERSALLKLSVNDFNALISTHPQVLELLKRLMEERMGAEEEFSLKSLGLGNEDFETLI
ncbi:MAG: cyclic nucleotide-binding domain-containing protein [Proteobacteria bacterium]|nr:cyclic nucleotide-binding domain-containing protein [Cystobacterineae bacterium]MCL2259358.1 cyclic nucleotide-binding domain-containing protein [Cystobacterineae bacterium]MCL2314195.1 cyclic nucleotide-binding domain-containing protein [Pseudomonadota bacterium]